MEEKITIYTTHCPMCRQLERQLDMKGLKYESVDDLEKMKEMGFMSAPMLVVDDKQMDFRTALRWVKEHE